MWSADGVGDEAIALVDLGDTLCDCSGPLHERLAALRGPGEDAATETREPPPAHVDARRRQIMGSPGFWLGLPPRASGFGLLEILHAEGFGVRVLSKGPRDAPQAWADKLAWCRRHLPEAPVIITDDKSLVFGHVLVDDWPPYVAQWQKRWPHGLAIVPAQPWNADMREGPRCIRYDGNAAAVRRALRALRHPPDAG